MEKQYVSRMGKAYKVQGRIEWSREGRVSQLRAKIGGVTGFNGEDGSRNGQVVLINDGGSSAKVSSQVYQDSHHKIIPTIT